MLSKSRYNTYAPDIAHCNALLVVELIPLSCIASYFNPNIHQQIKMYLDT